MGKKKKEKKSCEDKKISEILEQKYLTAKDLQCIIPELGYNKALTYIHEARAKMRDKGYFVPDGKTKVALTKIIVKEYGL